MADTDNHNTYYLERMLSFIENSPTPYHVVANLKKELVQDKYTVIKEKDAWELGAGGMYAVDRNGSSLIAFRIPRKKSYRGFLIIASHSDSPSWKIKENPELKNDYYVRLNTEGYGGMLCAPWFDRPLSVAGRLYIKEKERASAEKSVKQVLVNVNRDLVMLPSLAIHMNRGANHGQEYNAAKDMVPLYGDASAEGTFLSVIAEAARVKEKDILGHDLYLYDRTNPSIWGHEDEFFSVSRIDNQECAYTTFQGFLNADEQRRTENDYIPVYCIFDNEEVGSTTKQGAASTFLRDTLRRIVLSLNMGEEKYYRMIAESFMISADNAHAIHPNHFDKADPVNRPKMNDGIVIKSAANQKYTTDAFSEAIVKMVCQRANVPWQIFTNRSDVPGGSTLGNISTTQVAIRTADIGLAQLAMHSPYETAGTEDISYMVAFAREFFGGGI